MADEKPTLHIDNDWKRQAQEEKRKLAEAEQKRKEEEEKQRNVAPVTPPVGGPPGMGMPQSGTAAGGAASASRGGTGRAGTAPGESGTPQVSFALLVQSFLTQALFYLGELSPRGAEPQVNLDMAKNQIDLIGVLEEKTKGNLTGDEQHLLDNALYEVRMRYVAVASQYATV